MITNHRQPKPERLGAMTGPTNGVTSRLPGHPSAFQGQANGCSVCGHCDCLQVLLKALQKVVVNKNQGNVDDPLWLNDFEIQQKDCGFQKP